MKRSGLRFGVALATVIAVGSLGLFAADEKPKYEISEVMQKCMKGGLCKKVASGKASDEEKKLLVEMFEALAANKPPRGEEEDWKKKTGALLAAAKAVHEGKEGAGKKLGGAANCMACHSAHKPKS